MILGGYEQNRIIGHVGTFSLKPESPQGYMLDVILGVETGASPFNQSNNISLWHGIDDILGATESEHVGGKADSRQISLDPSLPYLYLPRGI